MEPELKIYTKEIPAKGKGYFVIEKCWPDQLDVAVRRGASALLAQGATRIYIASRDPAAALAAGQGDGYRLEFRHDMLGMERVLDDERPRPAGRLTFQPLTRESGGVFLAIYNESFFDVPNSATYDKNDLKQILGAEYTCAIAVLDGVPVGIYEIGFKKENPEIGSVGLTKAARGKGLGRELLLSAMDMCAELGYKKAWLQVSTANENAYTLYRKVGFQVSDLLSHWYEVIAEGDLRA